MNFYARRFNLYLLLALVVCGCATHKKKEEKVGMIRVHVESAGNLPSTATTISVLRSTPVLLTIGTDPVVTEVNLITATLIETPGGFAVRVKFDESGTWMLDQATARNPGKHLAIFGQWGKTVTLGRWLAAPLINHRIADGTVTFTPDASREETEKLVEGLNYTARKENSTRLK